MRELGGLRAYPPRTKNLRRGGLLDRVGRLRCSRPAVLALTQHYAHAHFGAQPSPRFIALVGDAELDEGNVWEAIVDPSSQELGDFTMVINLNRQSLDRVMPDVAAIALKPSSPTAAGASPKPSTAPA